MKLCSLEISLIIVITLLLAPLHTSASRILFFIGFASHSHRVAIQPLAVALADRGHDVTFFSPILPEKEDPRIQEVHFQSWVDINAWGCSFVSEATALKRLDDPTFDPFFENHNFWFIFTRILQVTLEDREFFQWMNSSAKYDLIIVDHPGEEFVYPMAYRMGAKTIPLVTYTSLMPNDLELFGLPDESSWFQDMVGNPYGWLPDWVVYPFNLLYRFHIYRNSYIPRVERELRKALGWEFPPIMELMKEVNMIFLNEHYSASYPKAYPPMVVPIGGMHCITPEGKLEDELETFLSDVESFVFVSFGSLVQVSKLPQRMQETLFQTIASFTDVKFLWKWEGSIPDNMPRNAFVKNWFQQQKVLAHPKCKGFVTQGGQISMQQAVYHAVPVIVVPGFFDQPFSAKAAENHGYGIYLEISDITVQTFSDAIGQLIHNSSYAQTMQRVSQQFRDRPMHPVDTAVWWTEYVLRHDTSSLKSPGMNQSWWRRRGLHFWFLVFSIALVLTSSFVYFLCLCSRKAIAYVQAKGKVKTM